VPAAGYADFPDISQEGCQTETGGFRTRPYILVIFEVCALIEVECFFLDKELPNNLKILFHTIKIDLAAWGGF
jgi:hypothetical protein